MNEKKTNIRNRLSKLWPTKRWKRVLFAVFLMLLVIGVPVVGYLEWSVYREVTIPLDIKNPEGAKTALLIYHPGLTSFAHDVAYSFADGLVSNDWRVEIATASPEAPTEIANYDLLVLNWPIYDFSPGPTIASHIERIGDLQGIGTVIITVAGGLDPFDSRGTLEKIVKDANGTVTQSIAALRGGSAIADMRQEASHILP